MTARSACRSGSRWDRCAERETPAELVLILSAALRLCQTNNTPPLEVFSDTVERGPRRARRERGGQRTKDGARDPAGPAPFDDVPIDGGSVCLRRKGAWPCWGDLPSSAGRSGRVAFGTARTKNQRKLLAGRDLA